MSDLSIIAPNIGATFFVLLGVFGFNTVRLVFQVISFAP